MTGLAGALRLQGDIASADRGSRRRGRERDEGGHCEEEDSRRRYSRVVVSSRRGDDTLMEPNQRADVRRRQYFTIVDARVALEKPVFQSSAARGFAPSARMTGVDD